MRLCLVIFMLMLSHGVWASDNWFASASLQKHLDFDTYSKQYAGNKIDLLINGVQSFKVRNENIANADVILVKTYEIHNDETGQDFVRALSERARAGALIVLQYDVTGSIMGFSHLLRLWRGSVSPLLPVLAPLQPYAGKNVFIIPVNAPAHLYQTLYGLQIPIDHAKYLITWQVHQEGSPVRVVLGGMNIGNQYAYGGVRSGTRFKKNNNHFGYRDTDVQVQGPVALSIVEAYANSLQYHLLHDQNTWFVHNEVMSAKQAYSKVQATVAEMKARYAVAFPKFSDGAWARFVENPPHSFSDGRGRNILRLLGDILLAIPKQKTVTVVQSQFSPPATLHHQMNAAAKRGVHFVLLLNSPKSPYFQMRLIAIGARAIYRTLDSEHYEIYDWLGSQTQGVSGLHQKIWNLGQEPWDPVIIGSVNCDRHSLLYDNESALVVQSPVFKQQINQMLANDIHNLGVETVLPARLYYEPTLTKLKGWIIHTMLHPIL